MCLLLRAMKKDELDSRGRASTLPEIVLQLLQQDGDAGHPVRLFAGEIKKFDALTEVRERFPERQRLRCMTVSLRHCERQRRPNALAQLIGWQSSDGGEMVQIEGLQFANHFGR